MTDPPEILTAEAIRKGLWGAKTIAASHEALRARVEAAEAASESDRAALKREWRVSSGYATRASFAEARVEALTAALAAVVEEFNKDDHTFRREPWNAPGHAHSVRERWDGWGETRHQQPCELCIAWNRARALSVTKPERCPTCRSTSPEFCYRGGRHTHGYHWFGDINVECCPDDFHRDGRVPRG